MPKPATLFYHPERQTFTPRDYQQDAVDAGIAFFNEPKNKMGNGILVLPTGSGKSLIIALIIQGLVGKTIVLQPSKEILEQNYEKLQSYGYTAGIYSASLNKKEVRKITFATIGSVVNNTHMFQDFQHIIIDECFPDGSMVDGNPIESLVKGDLVRSYNHHLKCVEYKKVVTIFKKKVTGKLVSINLSDGTNFICTDNHPIFTNEFGYMPAISLSLCNNTLLTVLKVSNESQDNTPLFSLRYRVQKKGSRERQNILQRHLYEGWNVESEINSNCELQSLPKGISNTGLSTDKLQQNRKGLLFKRMRKSNSIQSFRRSGINNKTNKGMEGKIIPTNDSQQSYVDAREQRKNDCKIQRTNFFEQGWKWATNQTANVTSCIYRVTNGISNKYRTGKAFVSVGSKFIQSGFGRSRKNVSNRSGRGHSQIKEVAVFGSSENGNTKRVRVESVEVYQSGSGCRFEQMCPDNFVYNIEVEDNHNYFVSDTLVHNCDLVNSNGGMYKRFIDSLDKVKVLGLTATPYRLASNKFGSELRFITRTKSRIFKRVIYYINTKPLFAAGHLSPLRYYDMPGFSRKNLVMKTNGSGYTDESVKREYDKSGIQQRLIKIIMRLVDRGEKHILVFTQLVKESIELSRLFDHASYICSDTKLVSAEARVDRIKRFKSGDIKIMFNVGVLAVGFDFPACANCVIARPTMSLRSYYQWIGRIMRPHPSKEYGMVIDLCGNIQQFGAIEDLYMEFDKDGKWVITSRGRQLTNVTFGEGKPAYLK